jgi:Predicted nucleic acid-binding protein, contains PIN domain
MWVFDATPLIYLAKVDRLGLVERLEGRCVIPERVAAEVVETGLDQGYPDARRIDRQIEVDRFDVVSVAASSLRDRLGENSRLSDADVDVLACADAHDGVAVMDETYGRDVAATEGITTRGTAYVVLRLATQDAIDVDEARTVIDAMVEAGWYCAPDVYARIVQRLESLEE